MEQQLTYGQKADEMNFQLTDFGTINSEKHTLFDTLFDPQLDSLCLDDRIAIFDNFIKDWDRHYISINRRYSFNGCATERDVFDPSLNQVVRMVNFASNDYLNMSQHPRVIGAAIRALETYGTGSGASCITGRTHIKSELEQEIADTFECEKALVYPTGYMTNTGVLTSFLRSNDVAIVDMFAHASIMDGVESRNKLFFQHNDMRSLERAMMKADSQYTNKIVVVDAVYSMDGDIANLPEIAGLCKKYRCKLMVDEAHAFGVIGKKGLGIADHFGLPSDAIDILVGTLSKAIGSTGGFVTGKKELINYLIFASRPYFFTTAPFVPAMAAALESIRVIKTDQERRDNLWNNIRYFRSKLQAGGFNIGAAETAIFPIILGNHNLVMNTAPAMGRMGVLAAGVPYPAVSRKQTRIRMNVTSEMTQAQLDKGYDVLCRAIQEVSSRLGEAPRARRAEAALETVEVGAAAEGVAF